LRRVGFVVYSAAVGERVVHGQLLLQVPNLPLILLEQDGGVQLDVHAGLVDDLPDARGELERGDRFFQMGNLGPDVGVEDGLAVAADGVLEDVGELGLAVGDVVALLVGERDDHLLQEGERLVDVGGLDELLTAGACR